MRSILLVDDDADIRESVRDVLVAEGHEVNTAVHGREALRLLREHELRPDLILLDLMMPEMDGWTFRAEQRKDGRLASIPVVVFTAHATPATVAKQLDALGYLRKPLWLDDLLAVIDRIP
jgi:two-component system response regulator MprA